MVCNNDDEHAENYFFVLLSIKIAFSLSSSIIIHLHLTQKYKSLRLFAENIGYRRQDEFNNSYMYIKHAFEIFISPFRAAKETPPYCRESRDRIDFGLTKYHDQERKEFIVY